MTDILFYHLERQPLQRVLPFLLEKSLERGWRALVRTPSQERVQAIDEMLWTSAEDGFLPHAMPGELEAEHEPILITSLTDEPNQPHILFLVDGSALPDNVTTYERIVLLFDGNDELALSQARMAWKEIRARGLNGTYWQQNDGGRWEKKA